MKKRTVSDVLFFVINQVSGELGRLFVYDWMTARNFEGYRIYLELNFSKFNQDLIGPAA
jgi:hypothetical protein